MVHSMAAADAEQLLHLLLVDGFASFAMPPGYAIYSFDIWQGVTLGALSRPAGEVNASVNLRQGMLNAATSCVHASPFRQVLCSKEDLMLLPSALDINIT